MASGYDVSPDDFLLAGGKPSAKFENVGDTITGVIIKKEMRQERDYDTDEPKFYKDSTPEHPKPIMQLVLTLQTSEKDSDTDDGQRNVYVRTNLRTAIASAVRSAGATGLAIGGGLQIQFSEFGVQTNPKFKKPKLYKATYIQPSEPETPVEAIEPPKPEPVAPVETKVAAPKASASVPAELPDDAAKMLAQMMAAKQG